MIGTEELRAALEHIGSELDQAEDHEALFRELLRRREEMAFELSGAEAANAKARKDVIAARGRVAARIFSRWRRRRLLGASLVCAGVAITVAVTALFGWASGRQWLSSWDAPLSAGWTTALLWTLAYMAGAALLYDSFQCFTRDAIRRRRFQVEERVAELEQTSKAADEARGGVLVDIVREHVNEVLNANAGPLFGTTLRTRIEDADGPLPAERPTLGAGLSEVTNEENRVPTPMQRILLRMIASTPGASLGISGPRGVGKSSLLATLCAANPTMSGRPAIAINTSAPVEYEARDFLLHLFATLCRQILRTEVGENDDHEDRIALAERTAWRHSSFLTAIAPLSRLMMFGGIALGIAALLLAALQTATLHRDAELEAMTGTPRSEQRLAASPSAAPNKQPKVVTPAMPQTVAGSPTTSLGNRANVASQITDASKAPALVSTSASSTPDAELESLLSGLLGSPLFNLAVILLVFGSTAQLATGPYRAMIFPQRNVSRHLGAQGSTIAERATRELRNINFQRSYTAGWSGSLKAPVGLELGTSDGLTLAERSQSLPEIVEKFRSFVRDVAQFYDNPVLIGIDELDKLRNAQQAEAFLDGVKAVFGIPRCFYLISVSEDALAAFERRGIGFRNAFDSALDDVVRIDFLNLAQSRAMLNRRILRLPDPFTQLCHMLSGGLPRDLIRHARALLSLAAEQPGGRLSLRTAAAQMAEHDLEARLRATSITIRALKEVPQTGEMLVKVASLPTKGTLDEATKAASSFRAHLGGMTTLPNSDEERALQRISEETAVHYEIIILVRRVASLVSTDEGWERATRLDVADRVARVRQALESGVAVANMRLGELKKAIDKEAEAIDRVVNPHLHRGIDQGKAHMLETD